MDMIKDDSKLPEQVSEDLVQSVTTAYEIELEGVTTPGTDLRKYALDALSAERVREQWEILDRFLPSDLPPDAGILEIGSGFGTFVGYVGALGFKPYGIEIEFPRTQIAKALHHEWEVPFVETACGAGESLPFADNSFDVVYSINILEHVLDPAAVVDEAIRVLKPGGTFQFVIPNYGSWWEGHYALIWLPHTPKALGTMYVKLLGRETAYLQAINFITPGFVRRLMRRYEGQIEILGWGKDIWEERMRKLSVMEWAALGKLKTAVQWLHRLKLIELAIRVGCIMNWHTPIILSLRKR